MIDGDVMLNRLLLFVILFLYISSQSFAANPKVYIHTDNLVDLAGFQSGKLTNSLSLQTNGNVLKVDGVIINYEYMTPKRSFLLMDEGKDICVVNKIKTPDRLRKYLFSSPVNMFLNRRLYQKSNDVPLKGINGEPIEEVFLPSVFKKRPNSRLLLTDQISYGFEVDEQLKGIPSKNKLVRGGSEYDNGVFEMFFKNRGDFVLFLPQQVYNQPQIEKTRSYKLSQIKPYELGHLMCADTRVNHEFLTSVNENIKKLVATSQLLTFHLQYLSVNEHKIFEQYFKQEFY